VNANHTALCRRTAAATRSQLAEVRRNRLMLAFAVGFILGFAGGFALGVGQ